MSLDPSLEKNSTEQTNSTNKDTTTTNPSSQSNTNTDANSYPELDLVFCMDCTASMGTYIEQGKNCIMTIVQQIKASEKADVRFAYIAYRDHKDTFVTKVHEFTTSMPKMREFVGKYGAEGGGDGPEAVAAAMDAALKLEYRKNAIKIIVLIADAPPHGVTNNGDDYPKGDPNGLDPIQIAKNMAEQGIVLYVVACEPALSGYPLAHDFMAGLAKITEGRYLPLTSAHLLPDVIIGGAKEEISLQKLEEHILQGVQKLKKEEVNAHVDEDELADKVAKDLASKGVKVNVGNLDDIYGDYDNSNIDEMAMNWSSMGDFKKNAKVLKQPAMKSSIAPSSKASSYRSSAMKEEKILKSKKKKVSAKKEDENKDAMEAENDNSYGSDDEDDNEIEMDISEDTSSKAQSYNVTTKDIDKSAVKKMLNRAKAQKKYNNDDNDY